MRIRFNQFNISKEEVILIFLILVIFLSKILTIHPTFSDENLYFLMGKKVKEGLIVYKDFSYVHPPLQIYTYALFFNLLGTSFLVAKLIPLIFSSFCVLLVFLFSREIFERKVALFAGLLFLFNPAFIAFSDQGYGMWEALAFLLLSLYFIVKQKTVFSAISLTLSLFFRYLVLIYLPFMIILIFLKKFNLKRFLFLFILSTFFTFMIIYSFFGDEFIRETILFQIYARFLSTTSKSIFQYFNFGFFTFFLCIISTIVALTRKDKLLMLFSLYPILIDSLLFLFFRNIVYHYFLLSLPFIAMATAKAFLISKEMTIKFFIILVFILAYYTNLPTLDFYLNPKNSENIYQVRDWIQSKILDGEKIFGEYSIVSYISLSTNIPVAANRFDTYLDYMKFEGIAKIIEELEKDKPKFIIDLNDYLISDVNFGEYIHKNYMLKKIFLGIPSYSVYQRK